ncbi:MAG: putative serine/threonine protein kinase, partial [Burkholderiales bacterium]|nr:putative serine/threonine protein kinase [Burkholderiales bacterium]
MPSQANQPLPEGTQLQNYRILRVLAAGGFSFVYLAHDAEERPVAIKEYLPATLALRVNGAPHPAVADEDLVKFRFGMKSFFEEAGVLARLEHANVVRVLDFFRANDTVYLVMRYERGRSLQEHIKSRRGPPEEIWVRNTFAQLLDGLREVHASKLLHLDIKPANVYLRNDGTPRCTRASPRQRRSRRTRGWSRTRWCPQAWRGPTSTRRSCSTSSTGACSSITSSARKACWRCKRPCWVKNLSIIQDSRIGAREVNEDRVGHWTAP